MTKKKKIIRAVVTLIALILVVLIAAGGYFAYRFNRNTLKSDMDYDNVFAQPSVTLQVPEDGYFDILKINDTHLFNGTNENDARTLNGIKFVLDSEQYDLIIADGDIVDGFNLASDYDKENAFRSFCALVDSYDIPWTFAPGNNDCEIDGDNEDIVAYMMQYSNFICGNVQDVDGAVQFMIDLEYNGSLVHSIAVTDSNSRTVTAVGDYDSIHQNQIEWLSAQVEQRQCFTSVFFHMPTPGFKTAYDNGTDYKGILKSDEYPLDDIKDNSLFDNAFADNQYISLISCAHVHSDNMCSFYNGRYYQLSSRSGYSASGNDEIPVSCTVTRINVKDNDPQTMYSFEQIAY